MNEYIKQVLIYMISYGSGLTAGILMRLGGPWHWMAWLFGAVAFWYIYTRKTT